MVFRTAEAGLAAARGASTGPRAALRSPIRKWTGCFRRCPTARRSRFAHDGALRLLPLRAADRHRRRGARPNLRVSLPRMPEAYGQRFLGTGALAGGMRYIRGPFEQLDAHGRQRPDDDLLLLSRLRLDRPLRRWKLPRP